MLANSALKKFCLRNHCAANVFLSIGIFQFVFTIWLAIEHQQTILHWLFPNILVNGAIFGLICVANMGLMGVCFCLGLSDCNRHSAEWAPHTYRGRGRNA